MGEKREGGNGSGCREENGEGWSREGKGVGEAVRAGETLRQGRGTARCDSVMGTGHSLLGFRGRPEAPQLPFVQSFPVFEVVIEMLQQLWQVHEGCKKRRPCEPPDLCLGFRAGLSRKGGT